MDSPFLPSRLTRINKTVRGKSLYCCSCGAQKELWDSHVARGLTRSCGCLNREVLAVRNRLKIKHGMYGTPEYSAWVSVIQRCTNPKAQEYVHYGARGIRICDEWRHDFGGFYAHLGLRPSPKHSLDRIRNEGNYEPGNVRWAIPEVQQSNRRNNRWIEFNGVRKTVAQWSRELGVHSGTIQHRIEVGWPLEAALTTPSKRGRSLRPRHNRTELGDAGGG